jgi:hypothetical protein
VRTEASGISPPQQTGTKRVAFHHHNKQERSVTEQRQSTRTNTLTEDASTGAWGGSGGPSWPEFASCGRFCGSATKTEDGVWTDENRQPRRRKRNTQEARTPRRASATRPRGHHQSELTPRQAVPNVHSTPAKEKKRWQLRELAATSSLNTQTQRATQHTQHTLHAQHRTRAHPTLLTISRY